MRIAVIALLTLVVAAGCGNAEEEAAPPVTTTVVDSPTGSVREAAPPLSGESLAGRPISLADYRGRPLLINVWSSW